jgi:fatty-acid desaturase
MSQLASTRRAAPNEQAPQPERDVLASRLAYLTVGLPTLGTAAAVGYAISEGLWLSDVLLFVAMYVITGLGVEGGLHRYFTHRSFVASEPVKVFLAVAGSMAAQGPVISGWRITGCTTPSRTPIAIRIPPSRRGQACGAG